MAYEQVPEMTGSFYSPSLSSHRLRRLHCCTFGMNGWFQTAVSDGMGIWGTQFLTLGCPDDFYAVRIGFPNIAPCAYSIPRIAVCPSTNWGDYANPTGAARPVTLTTAGAGLAMDRIATAETAPRSLTVAGNAVDPTSGEATVPSWSWTDWCNVNSVTPDPDTRMRVLMIRHTVSRNGGKPVTYNNGTFRGWTSHASIHRGYDYFCGGLKNGSDRTDFSKVNASVLPANSLINGSFACVVQFMTQNAGIVGMTTGDSHHQGTSTTGSFNSYLAQASVLLGQENVGRTPFGWVNCAVGGSISQQFFPYLQTLIGTVNPSYVVLPGWTANEIAGAAAADAAANNLFFSRLVQAGDVVRLNGAVPIWLTPFPRDAAFMTPARLEPWHRLRQTILAKRGAGEIVLDAAAVLGADTAGALNGTYLPTFSDDGIHPNDMGHATVASHLQPIIKGLAGL